MEKSLFEVKQMDCAAEENLVRMKLGEIAAVKSLAFDLPALVADSLDMLADAIVYGLSLNAIGASHTKKKTLASASGYFQLLLAVIGLIEVLRRFLGHE